MSFVHVARCRRGLRLVIALVILCSLLLVPALPAAAQQPLYTAQIIGVNGQVMGTATFTPAASGHMTISVQVRGFQPVGGDRRLAIGDVGSCCAPSLGCSGFEPVVLPNIQFFPDGSANYTVTTAAVHTGILSDANGSSIVIHADVSPVSAIIGCGVIVPTGVCPAPAPTPVPGVSFGPATTVVAPLGLQMRASPSLESALILTLANGETVFVSNQAVNNQGIHWVLVRAFRSGFAFDGWVASNYLASFGAVPPAQARVRVTASDGLRLRSGPGFNFAIRRIVPLGTTLRTSGVERNVMGVVWLQVQINGTTLWAARQYLQFV